MGGWIVGEATTLRRTPLHAAHLALGARMVPFAGWEMPVQYRGIMEEHLAVRSRAGLFDVSHMGEILVEGPGALETLQRLLTNDVGRLRVGQGLYSPMCAPHGGILDDLTAFRVGEERYLLVVNAATTAKDLAWVADHADRAVMRDVSSEMALLALQGPAAEAILSQLTPAPLARLRLFDAVPRTTVADRPAFLSRTGYTGEDGFEIGPAWEDAPPVWEALLAAGQPLGLQPAGLGARDTLRLEAGFMLYGSDIDETTTPLEAPLGWTVKWEKGDFIGRAALLAQRERGVERRLVGFTLAERAIARHGFPILWDGAAVGRVTSGTFSPTLQRSIGLGYVAVVHAEPGTPLAVEIRGRPVPGEVTRLPFYRRPKAERPVAAER